MGDIKPMSERECTVRAKPIIALVTNELTDYSYEISIGAQSILAAQGYHCLAVTGRHLDDPSSRAHNDIYQSLRAKSFAGALIYAFSLENTTNPQRLPALLAPLSHFPIVSIGANLPQYNCVTADQQMGMVSLMEHLIAGRRYQRFLFVRGFPSNADSLLRETIFREQLHQSGLLTDAEFFTGNYDGDIVYKEIYARLRRFAPPDVIVCANDRMAVAAINAVHDAGLRAPEDVAVTGFDNSPECDYSKIPLTTVCQPLLTMGQQAAEMLVALMAGDPVENREVPTQLLVRSSCGGEFIDTPSSSVSSISPQPDKAEIGQVRTALKRRDYLSILVMNLNLKLMEKTELTELKREVIALLPRLGIKRCFIALYEGQQYHRDAMANLFVVYDESAPELAQTFTGERFASCDLLPQTLIQNEAFGPLMELTPLVVGTENYGYMLFEWEAYYVPDFLTLPIIISSALRNIYQLQRLQEYALELEQRVEERTREMRLINYRLRHEIQERQKSEMALRTANEQLIRLASIDGLTQLENRATLDAYLSEQSELQRNSGTTLSLLFCDIDYFKNYNDTYGHQAGDDCLRTVANVFRKVANDSRAIAARYGGEEFALVLRGPGEAEAMRVAHRLMDGVMNLKIPHTTSAAANYVTLSIGLVTVPAYQSVNVHTLITHADLALYTAKIEGRNRLVCYKEQMIAPSTFKIAPSLSPVDQYCGRMMNQSLSVPI